jgi:hypothetical protein
MRGFDVQKVAVKRMIHASGVKAYLTHYSGTPVWGGDYDQTPTYSGTTTFIPIRVVPIRDELVFDERVYGFGDIHCWVGYDATIDINDVLYFSGTQYSGTYLIDNIIILDNAYELYAKRKDDTTETLDGRASV